MLSSELAAVSDNILVPGERACDGLYEFLIKKDMPCIIFSYLLNPPYGLQRVEFMNLPSPRAMKYSGTIKNPVVEMELPHETWRTAKTKVNPDGSIDLIKGTSMCNTKITMYGSYGRFDIYRRLNALDYIRANFCPGQPEPPPPLPPKPY